MEAGPLPEKKDTEKKEKTEDEEKRARARETLYEVLKDAGISNVTALANYLEIKPGIVAADEPLIANEKVMRNADRLVNLLGLKESPEIASLLVKICLQGRKMLGEIPKPTIASALIGKWHKEIEK